MRIVVGVTGASGSMLARDVLRLLAAAGAQAHLVLSQSAHVTIAHELGPGGVRELEALAAAVHSAADLAAPIASGSFGCAGMIIVPCSMRTLAAVAHGFGDTLLTRAADVALKERRRLVVLAREAPLNEAHLRAMLQVTRMGGIVAPPVPPFYARPQTLADVSREIAARAVAWLGLDPQGAMTRWSGLPPAPPG